MSLGLPPNAAIRSTVYEDLHSSHASRNPAEQQASLNTLPGIFRDEIFHDIGEQGERSVGAQYEKVYESELITRLREAVERVLANAPRFFRPIENGRPSSKDGNRGENHAEANIFCLVKTGIDLSTDLKLEWLLLLWITHKEPIQEKMKAGYEIIRFLNDSKETMLRLGNLDLEYPPNIFCEQAIFSRLYTLVLSNNRLISFPPGIEWLQYLKYLDLSNNRLKSVVPRIYNLENLEYLDLSENQLTRLPKEIGKLENLITLHVCCNHLISLPNEIKQLRKLKLLNFEDNPTLTSLPKGLLKLDRSCSVYIKGIGLLENVGTSLEELLDTKGYRGPKIVFSRKLEETPLWAD